MRTIQLKGGGEIVCTAIKVTYGAQNQAQITTLSGYLIKKKCSSVKNHFISSVKIQNTICEFCCRAPCHVLSYVFLYFSVNTFVFSPPGKPNN